MKTVKQMRTSGPEPSSFRDPSGFLFYQDGLIFRNVSQAYRAHYDQLLDSGLYEALAAAGLLISHEEVDSPNPETASAYKVIQPEQIPFISYPYEWSFSQLKNAALTTLRIQKKALEYNMSLKDCSAYNLQFIRGKPVFIDTLSFEAYREGEPWIAYRQFCQHFLAPLALMSLRDIRLGQLLRVYIDGVPLDLASSLLPISSRFQFSLSAHIHLHAKSQKRFAAKPLPVSEGKLSRIAFLGLIDSIERAVQKLTWRPQGTEWVDYLDENSYSETSLEHKKKAISALIDETYAEQVWDLGANTGFFSRVPASKGILAISADNDPACVEVNYQTCVRDHETHVMPLLLDLTNPSPGIGWGHEERMSLMERGPADVVMALALLHHLAISNNVPFDRIASFLSRICHWLIIEFVPKSDLQVQRLLSTREDIFDDYRQQAFEDAFGRHFSIRKSIQIQGSERVLYLMQTEGECS
jgi:hypothetical protein